MIEYRDKKSGALLFQPSGKEKELLQIKEENKYLKDKLNNLENMIQKLFDKDKDI